MKIQLTLATLVAAGALLASLPAAACPTHEVVLPTRAGKGKPREHKELLDTPFVKLVSVTLRNGANLPAHAAKEAVTIQALSGSGVVKLGKTTEKLDPAHMVLIAPGAEHEIVPDGKELVLLVHYLKGGGGDASHDGHEGHGADAHAH
jgi:quercetin dioxygenase-like cupin family protein